MASLERRVAIDAARDAGRLLLTELRTVHRIAFKGLSTNLVTEMDERAEELIVGRLGQAFPNDTILAEERGAASGRSGRRWIVDPLDGTTNYAHGVPIFCVSVALEVAGHITLGVAYDPSLDELYVAERGQGATLNDRRLAVSSTATLDESLLTTGFPYNIRETRDTNLREYAAFALRCRGVRRLGAAVLDLAWVAAGRLDGFWEIGLRSWDIAAGALLIREAGGTIEDLDGRDVLASGNVVAANDGVFGALRQALKEAAAG
jgi:myo-inositol-1(or 4)-monophosphatase